MGYGLLLVIAFSAGLAATLTSIGLLFVLAGRLVKQRSISKGRIVRLIPALSALLMAGIGGVICHEAITQSGLQLFGFQSIWKALTFPGGAAELSAIGTVAVLGLGFVFGLKHATEVDHVVAVSTIVSEHRNILHSALVGGLWGLGHTASLILAGVVVMVFRVAIPNLLSNWLELGVAGMIVFLGLAAFMRALRRRDDLHFHKHGHGSSPHTHTHFHESVHEHSCQVEDSKLETSTIHDHSTSQIGFKPLVVGMIHGLAGSGALTVLVLTQINSAVLGLTYLAVFGIGSIFGMLLMSLMVGLSFVLAARRLNGISYGLQASAGALSMAFGLWYGYETGVASGLLGNVL